MGTQGGSVLRDSFLRVCLITYFFSGPGTGPRSLYPVKLVVYVL